MRNGSNPGNAADAATHHWFLGAGMVHGVRLRGGRAEWYRNRYVAATDGPSPNTNVGGFAGTTWAMVEAGTPPVEMGYEPVVVPKADGTAEDDAWILTVVYDVATDASELHILDAGDITGDPVACISLPQRVPFGFHGNWVPDASVPPPT